MTLAKQRIIEFTQRQTYYGSSLVARLHSVKGYWHYKVLAWIDNVEFTVIKGKYNGEDPEELFNKALQELSLKKIKLGRPVTDNHSSKRLTS